MVSKKNWFNSFLPARRLFGLFFYDPPIDFGTGNTVLFLLKKGFVLYDPLVVAVNKLNSN